MYVYCIYSQLYHYQYLIVFLYISDWIVKVGVSWDLIQLLQLPLHLLSPHGHLLR